MFRTLDAENKTEKKKKKLAEKTEKTCRLYVQSTPGKFPRKSRSKAYRMFDIETCRTRLWESVTCMIFSGLEHETVLLAVFCFVVIRSYTIEYKRRPTSISKTQFINCTEIVKP